MFDKMNKTSKAAPEKNKNMEASNGDSREDGNNKRMSVERIYQKKSQLEHILLRPDTYIGSVEPITETMWVYDNEETGMVNITVEYC